MEPTPDLADTNPNVATADLVREAIEEGRELVKLEVELARNELEGELARVRSAAIAFAVAAFAASGGFAMALVAIVVASGAPPVVAIISALALFAIAGAAGTAGYRKLGTKLLGRTRERVGEDIKRLEESAHGTH